MNFDLSFLQLNYTIEPVYHLWFVLGLTLFALVSFAREKMALEVTAIVVTAALLLWGQVFPLFVNDENMLNAKHILSGYANPSLLAVLALLVMGQGIVQTDALRPVSQLFKAEKKWKGYFALFFLFIFILVFSGFLNNTPLVILAIPLLQSLSKSAGLQESRIMMPLSFIAILGGMTTLIGSSTNLLVSSTMAELGYQAIGFFEFFTEGAILAGVGFLYVVIILPYLLPKKKPTHNVDFSQKEENREFVAELKVAQKGKLEGAKFEDGYFEGLEGATLRMIRRDDHLILPPFEGYTLEGNDILVLSATREVLSDIIARCEDSVIETVTQYAQKSRLGDDDISDGEEEEATTQGKSLCEVMIPPASRLIDIAVDRAYLTNVFGAVLLGIQRRAKILRARLGSVRLQEGDVLLVMADKQTLKAMSDSQDYIVLHGSIGNIPARKHAPMAMLLFVLTILVSALGVIPITVSAFIGACAMVVTNCLNIRQAIRAIDRKIYFLVGSALGLGLTLQETGAASLIAEYLLGLPFIEGPLSLAAILFIIVAIFTNILTNNATAILFTPIALSIAANVGVDPRIFCVTVILAANCSFASPIGYQTNLLVMGPGQYRFSDFLKAGIPLILILWGTYIALAKFYYGL